MASANPLVQAFNAGRLGPRLRARVDLAKYQAGCNELENFIPTVQGPAVKRPGTRFALDAKYTDKNVRLVSFEYSREQAYMLEFGEQPFGSSRTERLWSRRPRPSSGRLLPVRPQPAPKFRWKSR